MDDLYRASLNKYAYLPLSYNPDDRTKLSDKLCEIALMEGWHDHNDILNTIAYPNRIRDAVIAYTPAGCKGDALYHSEEKYLTYVLTKDPGVVNDNSPLNTNWKKGPSDTLYMKDDDWQGGFSERIREKYAISRVALTKNEDNHSRVQKCFNDNDIKEDIYILRDVAYGCWADDIKKWGNGTFTGQATEQHIYNVQTSSGIYDPGPSLSYFSEAGKRCGYQDTQGKSRYGLFDCSFPCEIVLNYPAYIPSDAITCAEQLIYTKYKCTLFGDNTTKIEGDTTDNTQVGIVTKKVAEKMIESAAVNLIVEVPVLNTNGSVDTSLVNYPDLYLVTKHNSQKASSLFDLPLISSCIKYSARKDMIDIASSIYTFGEYNIITRSSPLKIMTKKFGDSGIAIQTLRPKLHFYEFEPQGGSDNVQLERKESNGIHAFLTFDQVAAAAAIEYGVPIVIYNTHDYAIIFISRSMKTAFSKPIEQLRLLLKSIKDLVKADTADATQTTADTTAADTAAAADLAMSAIRDAVAYAAGIPLATRTTARTPAETAEHIRTSSKSDIDYGVYLSFWYKFGPFVKIYNDTLKTNTILNADRDDIINKYTISKESSIESIGTVDNIINETANVMDDVDGDDSVVVDRNARVIELINNLTTISKSYREYNNMISSYKSATAAFSQVTGSIKKLISNPKTIKIGDVSKIIDNCDPFKGTVKEQRVRKLFTCLRGQSPAGIELGITVIIQIYENLSGSPLIQGETQSIQDGFKNQIISLFVNIAETCKPELREKLQLAFDFIPSEYKEIFVSTAARAVFNPPMTGGKDNSLSFDNSLTPDESNKLDPTIASSSLKNASSTENNSQMFDVVIDELTEIITYLDKSIKDNKSEGTGLLEDIKPLLEATKRVIEIQGSNYTKTLSSPLSYEHLEADTFIHQPLFIFSVLQTLLEYSSLKATIKDDEPQVLKGGMENDDVVMGESVLGRRPASEISSNVLRKRDRLLYDMFDRFENNTPITRSNTAPYRKHGMIKEWLDNHYSQIGTSLLGLPNNYINSVFLLNSTTGYDSVNTALNGVLKADEQYIVVYGYVISISRLMNIIKDVAIKSRSIETKIEDETEVDDVVEE